jgi:hypothetical protein
VKSATGASQFFKLIPSIREIIGLIPKTRHSKLSTKADLIRNEARNLIGLCARHLDAIHKNLSLRDTKAVLVDVLNI